MRACTHSNLRPIHSQGPWIEYACEDCGTTGFGRDRLEAQIEIADKYEIEQQGGTGYAADTRTDQGT